MKVAISVGGRFHAFDMARQLHRRKYLAQLITSYPKSKVGEWGIPRGLVRTVLSHEFLSRGWRLLARRLGWRSDPQFDFNDRYDRIAARRLLAGADITVAWSGMALQTLRVAQELGSWAVLERNSSHIQYQSDLMKEEYERLGWEPRLPDRRMIERELAEYEAADAICVPSTFACRSFVQRGVAADKLMMVPFGVSIEQFQPLAVEESPFRIIFCGALSIRKGLHYLLQAFQELDLPDAELWLVGPPTAESEMLLKKYRSQRVVLRGTFPQAELRREYARASVFCLPSIEEGFAMVITQAMACAVPVIASENTTGTDLIREGVDGYVIPIRDVEALKQRIMTLYQDPERRREMGRNARRRIETAGTWDHYGTRLEDEYRRLIEKGRANRRHKSFGPGGAR